MLFNNLQRKGLILITNNIVDVSDYVVWVCEQDNLDPKYRKIKKSGAKIQRYLFLPALIHIRIKYCYIATGLLF